MATAPFTLTVRNEEDLPLGVRDVHAMVTLSAAALPPAAGRIPAEVLVIDCSHSMRFPASRLAAAQNAAAEAIALLPDGAAFAVVAGTERATMIYPDGNRLVAATAQTRQAATAALQRIEPGGGTAMGAWLRTARTLLDAHPDPARHAIVLTDGHDESESAAELEAALAECAGHFTCDALGIGGDWSPGQLRRIAAALGGSADAADEATLGRHFRTLTRSSLARAVPDLRLRIRTTSFCRLRRVAQDFPQLYDLTERVAVLEPGLHELRTGAWAPGDEHSYHLHLELGPGPVPGPSRQVATIELHPRYEVPAQAIRARPTAEPARTTAVEPAVADHEKRVRMNNALQAGVDALAASDIALAERHWSRAIRLATELGDAVVLERLQRMGPSTGAGTMGLAEVPRELVLAALIGGSLPSVPPGGSGHAATDGKPVRCPDCGGLSPAGARYCSVCGHRIAGRP